MIRRPALALVLALASAGACGHPDAPTAGPPATPANRAPDTAAPDHVMTAPATASPRPPLRRLLAAHPETVARQVPAGNDARIAAYLTDHAAVPSDIAAALRAHELWAGMTEAEAILSVGPATRREPIDGVPDGFALFYAGEGWLLRFGADGYLDELVER